MLKREPLPYFSLLLNNNDSNFKHQLPFSNMAPSQRVLHKPPYIVEFLNRIKHCSLRIFKIVFLT